MSHHRSKYFKILRTQSNHQPETAINHNPNQLSIRFMSMRFLSENMAPLNPLVDRLIIIFLLKIAIWGINTPVWDPNMRLLILYANIFWLKSHWYPPWLLISPPTIFRMWTSGSSGCKSQAYRPPHAAPSAPHVARPPKWPQRPGRCRGLGAQEKIDNRHVIKMSWHPVTSTVILFCCLSRAFSYLLSSESYRHTLWRLLIWHLFLQSTEVMFFWAARGTKQWLA